MATPKNKQVSFDYTYRNPTLNADAKEPQDSTLAFRDPITHQERTFILLHEEEGENRGGPKIIGTGWNAAVRLVREEQTGKYFCLKKVSLSSLETASAQEKRQTTKRILKPFSMICKKDELNGPVFAETIAYGLGKDKHGTECLYAVSEYIEGPSFSEYFHSQDITGKSQLLFQAFEKLKVLYANDIEYPLSEWHSGNFLLNEKLELVLCDIDCLNDSSKKKEPPHKEGVEALISLLFSLYEDRYTALHLVKPGIATGISEIRMNLREMLLEEKGAPLSWKDIQTTLEERLPEAIKAIDNIFNEDFKKNAAEIDTMEKRLKTSVALCNEMKIHLSKGKFKKASEKLHTLFEEIEDIPAGNSRTAFFEKLIIHGFLEEILFNAMKEGASKFFDNYFDCIIKAFEDNPETLLALFFHVGLRPSKKEPDNLFFIFLVHQLARKSEAARKYITSLLKKNPDDCASNPIEAKLLGRLRMCFNDLANTEIKSLLNTPPYIALSGGISLSADGARPLSKQLNVLLTQDESSNYLSVLSLLEFKTLDYNNLAIKHLKALSYSSEKTMHDPFFTIISQLETRKDWIIYIPNLDILKIAILLKLGENLKLNLFFKMPEQGTDETYNTQELEDYLSGELLQKVRETNNPKTLSALIEKCKNVMRYISEDQQTDSKVKSLLTHHTLKPADRLKAIIQCNDHPLEKAILLAFSKLNPLSSQKFEVRRNADEPQISSQQFLTVLEYDFFCACLTQSHLAIQILAKDFKITSLTKTITVSTDSEKKTFPLGKLFQDQLVSAIQNRDNEAVNSLSTSACHIATNGGEKEREMLAHIWLNTYRHFKNNDSPYTFKMAGSKIFNKTPVTALQPTVNKHALFIHRCIEARRPYAFTPGTIADWSNRQSSLTRVACSFFSNHSPKAADPNNPLASTTEAYAGA